MAQDYHIYIHGDSSLGTSGNQTKPFSAKGSSQRSESFQTASTAFSTTKNIAQGNGASMGVAALTKVAPWLAIVIAAVTIADKVVSTGFAHQEEYTGHYGNNTKYNNFKTHVSNALHPVRYLLNINHQRAQYEKQNKAVAQQNRLIGNSILKDFNIGV